MKVLRLNGEEKMLQGVKHVIDSCCHTALKSKGEISGI